MKTGWFETLQLKVGAEKIFAVPGNYFRVVVVYTCKTTRGVGD